MIRYHNADDALIGLAQSVDQQGDIVSSRGGERVKEITDVHFQILRPLEREILNPARKASYAAQIAETVWVLSGRNDVESLEPYLPRARDFSDDGETWRGGYGPRLRDFRGVDQLSHVVKLLQEDPDTRRAVISLYDPEIDSQDGKDIPCNDFLIFRLRRGQLDLHVTTRSNDLIWGWSGINQFEWSVLLEVVAGLLGVWAGVISYSISSLHVYERHWAKLTRIAETPREGLVEPREPQLPGPLVGNLWSLGAFDKALQLFRDAEHQLGTASLEGASALIRNFDSNPALACWLRVLAFYHIAKDGDESSLPAVRVSVNGGRKVRREEKPAPHVEPSFEDYVSKLHERKHAAYGDSWKSRGELLSILPNIFRKVDRLGTTDDDETAADTAIDLLVYLLKYRWWLADNRGVGAPIPLTPEQRADEVTRINAYLDVLGKQDTRRDFQRDLERIIRTGVESIAADVERGRNLSIPALTSAILHANTLARREYWKANNATRAWKGYES